MASSCSFLSEEQFLCSICLDVFTEPISTPCGHNFCKACITEHWRNRELCHCPLCKETFPRGQKLRVNTGFRDVVEDFKKVNAMTKNRSPVKPGEVPCDCCVGTKIKALKSCLVCLASYCETHLEPHQRVPALKRHKLSDPVQNLEDRLCKKHDKILELFCRNDQVCVCVMCNQHKAHDTVPLDEAHEEKNVQLNQEKAEVRKMIQERQQKVQEINASVMAKSREKDEIISKNAELFTILLATVQIHISNLFEVIEEKQEVAQGQAGSLIKELEEDITELQRRSTELELLSNTQDHLHFLQNLPSSSASPSLHTKNWSNTTVGGHLCVCGEVNRTLVNLNETLSNLIQLQIREHAAGVCGGTNSTNDETNTAKKQSEVITDLEKYPVVTRLKIIQQQYEVDVTFDPDSASGSLLYANDRKQVLPGFNMWDNNPQRFEQFVHILGKRGFSAGRFYYEVQVEDKTRWDLGVVRESVGKKKTFTANPKNGTWILRLRKENKYQALQNSTVPISLTNTPKRVGVFVDYEGGLVSFYDVDAAALIYSFTGCNFRGKIFPFFSPGPAEGGRNCIPLVITPVNTPVNTQANTAVNPVTPTINKFDNSPYEGFWLIFVILALLWLNFFQGV
ncbi:E3 ubiquitin-protein ligase TRIM39-like [Genypterus blacodes]|uniref:E3 ubiquitin-protein ligase TRIM39-like n=1 Tax=Genypterus blacodes TaxID=154954 RepID=UPI003F76E826